MPAMPTGTPGAPSSTSDSDSAGASRHLVWVRCLTRPHSKHQGDEQWPLWLAACHRLTPYLQRFAPDTALLDVGVCTDAEAVAIVQMLITQLQNQQVILRAAIGPSGILAQLALLHAPAREPLTHLATEKTEKTDLLRQLPITALTQLQFGDQTVVTPAALAQAVGRLDNYGVRSLAHLARLDEISLRRQFGARLGSLFAAVARGEDILPFQPTTAPLRLHFRLRLKAPLAVECLVAGLAPFTLEVASGLARRGLQAHTFEVHLRWESGAEERVTRTLAQPIAGGSALNETVRHLLRAILQDDLQKGTQSSHTAEAIADFHLIVSHLVPLYPVQHAFWRQRNQRFVALHQLADALTRRYGKPLLFRSMLTAPDAIFEQDRSRFTPLEASGNDGAGMADVLEGQEHGWARPAADVAEITDASKDIPHGLHWW